MIPTVNTLPTKKRRSDQKGITQLVEAVRRTDLSARKATKLVKEIINQMGAALVQGEDVEVPRGKIEVRTFKGAVRTTYCLHTNFDGTKAPSLRKYPGKRCVIKLSPSPMVDNLWPAEPHHQWTPNIEIGNDKLAREISILLRAFLGAAPDQELLDKLKRQFVHDDHPLRTIRESIIFIQQMGLSYNAITLPDAIRVAEEIKIRGGFMFERAFNDTVGRDLKNILKNESDLLRSLRDNLHTLDQLGQYYTSNTLPDFIGLSKTLQSQLAECMNGEIPDLDFMGKVLNTFKGEELALRKLLDRIQFLRPLGGIHSRSTLLEALSLAEAIENQFVALLRISPNPDLMPRWLKLVGFRLKCQGGVLANRPVLSTLHACLAAILSRGRVYSEEILFQELSNFDYEHFPFKA